MSCYDCLTKFSFFTREHSCPNCGISFCSKCLKEKVTLGDKEKSVCKHCHKKLTLNSDEMSSSDVDATPVSLLKRLETLENPAKPPITIFRHSARLSNLKSGLSSPDKEILERLEKLKADRAVTVLPDENEIKRRLALLQDRSEELTKEKSNMFKVTSKSEQEEVDDLLKQYTDEAGIEFNMTMREKKNVEELEQKLRKLKSGEGSETLDSTTAEPEDDDAVTARIIQKTIAEGQLERKLQSSLEKEDDDDDDELDLSDDITGEDSELPWCIICNENACIKCFGCDGSLYCDACFKQGHEFFNMEDHKFEPFQGKE